MNVNTPMELINILSFWNREFSDYKDLTLFVINNSKNFKIPYSSSHTGRNRKTQTFCCRYGGRIYGNNTAKTNCPSFISYYADSSKKWSIGKTNWCHNHSLDTSFTEAHCNCLSSATITKIRTLQSLGVNPGEIRSSMNLSINSNQFYNIRRDIIKTQKTEKLDDVLTEIHQSWLKSNVYKDNSGEIKGITVGFNEVCAQLYSKNILIVDDTASTNIYNWILEVAVAIDQEGKNQILMFGLFPDKSINSYKLFFKDMRTYLGSPPRVIIVDRSISQYSAIKCELPETYVGFCLRHLGKDLLKYFDENSDVVHGFYNLQKDIYQADEYLKYINNLIKEPKYQDCAILKWMVEFQNNWVPKNLITNGVINEWTTNRIEGLFGNFKQTYGFTRFTMKKLIKNILIYMKNLMSNSIASQSKTNMKFQTIDCISESDIPKIGKYALSIIAEEYCAYKEGIDNSPYCYLCALHIFNPEIELPCRHRMQDTISIDSIPKIYLRNFDEKIEINNDHHVLIFENSEEMNYSDYINKIAPYASIAQREPKVAEILKDAIQKLDSERIEINHEMPLTFSIKGKISNHPANNVIFGGHPKIRKSYCCSICHKTGHNKNHCPNKF